MELWISTLALLEHRFPTPVELFDRLCVLRAAAPVSVLCAARCTATHKILRHPMHQSRGRGEGMWKMSSGTMDVVGN